MKRCILKEIYQTVQRLPEQAEMQGNTVTISKTICEDGTPGFTVEDANHFLGAVTYNLYREDQESGQTISLGVVPAYYDTETGIYQCRSKGEWASIDGSLCHLEMLNIPLNGNYDILFNIPISVDARRWNLRSGFRWQNQSFEVYGLWQGFNADNVQPELKADFQRDRAGILPDLSGGVGGRNAERGL